MKKTKITTKVQAMFLAVLMAFSMISVGIVVPDTALEADAATVGQTISVGTIAELNNAIATANSAGTNVITTIKLKTDIIYNGSLASFTAISSANIKLDLSGYNILLTYTKSDNYGSDDYSVQLPSENAGSKHEGVDTLTKGMFNVSAGSTLQIISSANGSGSTIQVFTDIADNENDNNKDTYHQTSSSIVYSEGTLIIGDPNDSTKNDVNLYAHASTRNTNKSSATWIWKQCNKSASTNSYAVTVNSDSAVFKMYGGKVQATGVSKGHREGYLHLRVYALNVNACYSAEIYGGEINLCDSPYDGSTGLRCSTNKAAKGDNKNNAIVAAIRNNTANLYIFDVDCFVKAHAGADTSKDTDMFVFNIYALSGETTIYGGEFSYTCKVEDGDSDGDIYAYTVGGNYYIAVDNSIRKLYGTERDRQTFDEDNTNNSASFVCFTLFIHGGGTAENGLDIFSFNTFRDYIAMLGSATDIYAACSETASHHGDANSYTCNTYNYLRNGYIHTGWIGKTHPAGALAYSSTGAASLNAINGGSLFLEPSWTENVYNITYDFNDADGATKVIDTSTCPTTYSITSTSTLGTPVRNGYKFLNWEVTKYEYPTTDTKTKVWSLATYPAGFSLNGRNGHIWLKANWEAISYNATFDLNGGNISGNGENVVKAYTVNTIFQFPQSVEKAYYSFDGNYKVATADGSWAANNTLYAAGDYSTIGSYGNPVFIAQFTPIQYTVTYDSNNGSSVDDENAKSYNVESKHTLPAVTRTGYSFVGWVPASSSGSWSGAKTYPAGTSFEGMNGNVTLVAKWESATYKLNLDLDETESISGSTEYNYAYSSSLTINNPTKTGYSFTGWKVTSAPTSGTTWVIGETFTDGIADGMVTIPSNRIGDVTLVPMWEKITYTVSFNSNGGGAVPSYTFTIVDSFKLPTASKVGYTFAGWSVVGGTNEGNWIGSYTGGQTVSGMYGNVQLIANWTKAEYTVTLNVDGGVLSGPSSLGYNIEANTSLPTPTKTGYTFEGWKVVGMDASSSWALDTKYTDMLPAGGYGNVTLKAMWEHTAYNIAFRSVGTDPADIKYYIDSEEFTLPTSAYPGYNFLYWEVLSGVGNWTESEKIYSSDKISGRYGSVTLNANFSPITYTITYKYPDGTQNVVSYDLTQTVTIPAYGKDGYTFSGWRVESVTDGTGWTGTYQPGELPAGERYGNVVLTPVLSATEYEISFIPDGGTPYANLSYTVEATDTLPTPEKTGYDFAGWKVTSAGGSWADGAVVMGGTSIKGYYGDVTLTAQWTPKKYLITWETGKGTVTTECEYGKIPDYSEVDTDKAPDAQYTYTFTGWSPALVAVTGEATYTAEYSTELNSYIVTWKYEEDESGTVKTQTNTYKYGEHPVFNNGINPVKASSNEEDHVWRFTGWKDSDGKELLADTLVTGNVTYTAIYTEVKAPRTVTWIINGVSQETKWAVGETPSYVGTPTKADADGYKYTFSHWTPEIVKVENDTDYTYTAVFTKSFREYVATFDLNGGTYTGNPQVTYTRDGLTMPKPTKDGYAFVGWKVVKNDGKWTQTETLVDSIYAGRWGDVSFIAVYTPVEYTITVEADDGSKPEYKYTIESTDTLPTTEKDGYKLTAWTIVSAEGNWTIGDVVAVDKVLTGMYGDVTIHPVWGARLYKVNWVSGDITQTVEFKFGESIVAYPPVSKAGYTAAWDKEIPAVMPSEDLTFTAVYTPIQYYLRFNTNGGSAVENFYYDITSTDVLPTPVRSGATFKGWRVSAGNGSWVKNKVYSEGTSLTGFYGNVTLTAVWEIEIHTVTWIAGDVTRVTKWYHGATPSFDGTPYKSSDDLHSYEFIGWDKEIVTVESDITYTALFKEIERLYTVKWLIDGYTACEKQYKYGETPVYDGEEPVRASTAEFDFTFSGWSPEMSDVTGDITYTALFDVFTKLQGLRIDKTAIFLDIGGEAVVTAILSPSTATVKDVVWTSANESIATVNASGKITAIGVGDTLICVKSKDGVFKSYCVVSVAPVVSEIVVISANGVSTTRLPGEAIQLTATVMPENTTNKNITWSSSDTTVATVDSTGLVLFGDVIGTAVITAKSDGYGVGTIEVRTTLNEDEVNDTVKTYTVMYLQSTSSYIIEGNVYESINIIYVEGDTVEFLLTEPHFATANGVRMARDTDGYFRIENISDNYSIFTVERADIGFDDNTDKDDNRSFFDKLKDFFRSIIEFFRNLFG